MNLEPHTIPPTIRAIFEHYKAARKNNHRPHLGGSQIGQPCERALWYQFRWMASPDFDGRMLRLFETGDREEFRLIDNLRAVGVQVWARDPDTGQQFRAEEFGGHFALSVDGVGSGFEESSKSHVLEFKTMNQKAFDDVCKHGLEKSKPVYWAQVQVGMHLLGLERAYFFAVCKNTDHIYGERVPLRVIEAEALLQKAGRIIFAEAPPARIHDDPAWWQCKFCDFHAVCHQGHLPEINCRTCAHITPRNDGAWHCAFHDAERDTDAQREGCTAHVWNPHAMPHEPSDAGADWVEYIIDGETWRNQGREIKKAG